jgi:signal peptidase I
MASSDGEAAVAQVVPTDAKAFKKFAREVAARAEHLDGSGRRVFAKHGKTLPETVQRALQEQFDALSRLRKQDAKARDLRAFADTVDSLDQSLDEHLGKYRKSVAREYFEAIAWAVLLTLLIRAFVFEAFKIPTGSMIPTLQIHDHLFVNKFLYGLKIPFTRIKFLAYRQPMPGEIVVFEYPYDDDPESTGKDLIKRVVAVPGDRVRMIDNVLHRNGTAVKRKIVDADGNCGQDGELAHRCVVARECLNGFVYTTQHHRPPGMGLVSLDSTPDWPPAAFDVLRSGPNARPYSPPDNAAFPDFVVPQGHMLVMGDNRDNSKDGRFFGLVPFEVVKGKAGVLWFATTFSRIGSFVHETTEDGTCDRF